jgi:16S rRNA (cytidine1402-2'-O)-methyltransferase
MSKVTPGTLYIVATPIGNLADISLRALDILKKVVLIAAEDTRHSRHLLENYGIKTKLISLHGYNEAKKLQLFLDALEVGKDVALISDAGTPLISDPGSLFVKSVRAQNIKVVPIPGSCAAIAALSVSGLETAKFVFEGFLPIKAAQRRTRLQYLMNEERTVIIYEAPHRILKLIDSMLEVFGPERYVVIAKELTKIFETVYGATLSEIKVWLTAEVFRQKGEFVVLLQGIKKTVDNQDYAEAMRVLNILAHDLPLKQAVKLTAAIFTINKRELYKTAVQKNPII